MQHAVPTAWRPVLRDIVGAFVREDYRIVSGIPAVGTISADTAAGIQRHILGYGARLIPLPDQAWMTSVCMWYGEYWDVLVDLWTEEEGPSDLVLSVRVKEIGNEFTFTVYMVHVP